MDKNEQFTLEITGMTAEGNGVGHKDGMAVFVAGSAPGDVLTVHVIKVLKKYAIAKIMEIITPSPDRVLSDCACSEKCGGCVWRHISYAAECKIKWQRVADALKRIGGLTVEPQPLIAAQNCIGYRNKAQYPVGPGPVFGFYAPHSHRITPAPDCLLQPRDFKEILDVISAFMTEKNISVYEEEAHKGLVRHVYLRKGFVSGEMMVCLVINGKKLPDEQDLVSRLKQIKGVHTVLVNLHTEKTNVVLGKKSRILYGDGYITDRLGGITVKISPLSFYQVNRDMAEILYEKAAEYADIKGGVLLDLYCGAGTIGLSMAKDAKQVIGAEIIPEAVLDAEENARANGIENACFLCLDAADAAKQLAQEGIRPDVVVVDPPRKGLAADLIETIAKAMCPARVVYVSCDAATLARDLSVFEQLGYTTEDVTPVDLFPRTAHVECVAKVVRNQ